MIIPFIKILAQLQQGLQHSTAALPLHAFASYDCPGHISCSV
jgi:hypothetical protein